MVRLFRKSEERIAQEAAAQAEIDRLKTLSVQELAVMLLPALGPPETAPGHNLRPQQLCEYLLRDCPGHGQSKPLQLMYRVRRALDRLYDAGLVDPGLSTTVAGVAHHQPRRERAGRRDGGGPAQVTGSPAGAATGAMG